MRYVIVTAARNERDYIAATLASVVGQTVLPERWIIVDDGSTDDTAAIVEDFAAKYPFIQLEKRPPRRERTFAGKARAVNAALELMAGLDVEVMCNLDADVSFEPGYMEFLLQKFQ